MPRERKAVLPAARSDLGLPRGRCLLIGMVLLGISWGQPCRASLSDYLQLPQLFPEHDLQVVQGNRPDWKKDWDNGRRLVRSGEYREAAESYRRLLATRGNIEEARWELALILARLDEWDKAKPELELLAEASPDNLDYLNVLGLALRRTSQSGRALEIFSKVRGRNPEDFTALVGEALGFLETGRKREALPLLQIVAAKNPEDRDLSLALVGMACELGQLETARKYLVPLASARKVDLEILIQAARVHDGLGREKEGGLYWEKVLALDPANREARERLVRYYEELGQQDKVLVHLQALLESDPKNIAFLYRICQIYAKSAPFAEGLPYFEKYLQLRPNDLDFIRAIITNKSATDEEQIAFLRRLLAVNPEGFGVLQSLAAELVAVGNLPEAVALWERVARATPERLEVYRELDPLLTKLGRETRLLEVLTTLHRLDPADQAVIGRLARLSVGRGDLRAGLEYYDLLEQTGYGGSDLFAERSALYEVLGQPWQTLADYGKLLAVSPERNDIRCRGMELAGKLGAVRMLARLAAGLGNVTPVEERSRQTLQLADAFALARDAERAAGYYQLLLAPRDAEKGDGEVLSSLAHRARLGLVALYRRDGRLFEAEQLLREGVLAEESRPGDLLFQLFDLVLTTAPPDLESAAVWLEQYRLQPQVPPGQLVIMQARLLAGSGEYSAAVGLLRALLTDLAGVGNKGAEAEAPLFHQAGLALAEVFVAAGDQPAAEQQCLTMVQGQADQEVLTLLAKIYLGVGEEKAAEKIMLRLTGPATDGIQLLELAELFQRRGLPGGQFTVAEQVCSQWPESSRAGFLRVEALEQEGKISEALAASVALGEKFPELTATKILLARLNYQGGFYLPAIKQCELVSASQPDRLDVQLLRVRSEMALLNQAEATRLVQNLYPVPGGQYLKKLLLDSGLPLPVPRQQRSLWQILTFRSEPFFDLVAEVLSARAFVDPNPERQKINALVAPELARLRWEKRFRGELARAGDFAQGEGKLAKKK